MTTHSVTLVCRVDSLNDKKHLDNQVSTILKTFKKHFKGRRSDLTPGSEIQRKYIFHELSTDDANRLKSIATENRAQLCMKSATMDGEPPSSPKSPPSSPLFAVPTPTVSLGDDALTASSSSVSSSTKSLVLNFGVDSPLASPAQTSDSFFSSASDSDSDSDSGLNSGSDSGSDVGVGTSVTTPEILLLRELAEIMKVSSIKPTPSQIGKAVSTWFVTEKVQNVLRRIV